jgi:hypothetical protein
MERCSSRAAAFVPLLASVAFAADALHVKGNVATLSDDPGIRLETSSWKHSNSSNPFLVMPDQLTNAMVGVTRHGALVLSIVLHFQDRLRHMNFPD